MTLLVGLDFLQYGRKQRLINLRQRGEIPLALVIFASMGSKIPALKSQNPMNGQRASSSAKKFIEIQI